MKRIVAIDFGLTRIGIAMTDPMQIIAVPFACLEVKGLTEEQKIKKLEQALKPFAQEIDQLVIGLPLEKSGLEGNMAKQVRQFASSLTKQFTYPIHFVDERLTSKQAQKVLKEQGLNRKKISQLEDQTAACLILQNFLATICA